MTLTIAVFVLMAALFVVLQRYARRQAREHPLGRYDGPPTFVRLVYGPGDPRPFDWQRDDV